MEESDVTALVDELAQYAQVLDASFDDQNPMLLASVSPATLNDHEGVTLREHQFVNVLSPSSSSVAP